MSARNPRQWYRQELAALDDDALALTYLRLLRAEVHSGSESWQLDEAYYELHLRGLDDRIEAVRQRVRAEETARRSQGRKPR